MMEERELRQYFDDVYLCILGSYLKAGHSINPQNVLHDAELQWKALVNRMIDLSSQIEKATKGDKI